MKNHYVSRPLKYNDKMSTTAHSLVYGIIPQDKLITQESIVDLVITHLNSHPEDRKAFGNQDKLRVTKQTIDILNLMVSSHQIAEIPGRVLEKIAAAV